jgi:hypothetical protein
MTEHLLWRKQDKTASIMIYFTYYKTRSVRLLFDRLSIQCLLSIVKKFMILKAILSASGLLSLFFVSRLIPIAG